MSLPISKVHPSWAPIFEQEEILLKNIFENLDMTSIAPPVDQIFRAFENPLHDIKVVIFGQDPYPGESVADGLAFSSQSNKAIPASLRNIYKEYGEDLALPIPSSPNLSKWSESGVMLLNRTLTTASGERNAHVSKGWSFFTYQVAKLLGERDVVAILWGNYARELAPLFTYRIESVHPSPLSARKGFFHSKPFSRANELLREIGRDPIDWKL